VDDEISGFEEPMSLNLLEQLNKVTMI
jgi:hypothetical protein